MKIEKMKGKNKGKIMLYALSTCAWCKKTRKFLDGLGVEYNYIYVDQLEEDDRNKTIEEIEKWNPRCSFPTLVFNDEKCVVGYREDEIKEALNI
jgi:glutaredoxin-like protein NrdH